MNKLLEDLKQKFPLKEVAPYGFCLIVPGAEFDPDWEAELGEYKCFEAELDQKPVTLVRVVKAEKDPGEKTVYSPSADSKASAEREVRHSLPGLPHKYWNPEEDEVLVKLWNDGVPIEKMPPRIPGRTEAAIRLRIQRLEHHGTIKKRTRARGRPKKLRSGASTTVPTSVDTPVHTSIPTQIPTQIPTSSPAPAKNEVVSLLEQILDAVKPKEELVQFKSYCPGCRDSRSVEDSNVWKACPVCGGPLIVWNVEPGRETSS
jgi:hypothetical protein